MEDFVRSCSYSPLEISVSGVPFESSLRPEKGVSGGDRSVTARVELVPPASTDRRTGGTAGRVGDVPTDPAPGVGVPVADADGFDVTAPGVAGTGVTGVGVIEPGVAEPGVAETGVDEPGLAETGGAGVGVTETVVGGGGVAEPGVSGVGAPGAAMAETGGSGDAAT